MCSRCDALEPAPFCLILTCFVCACRVARQLTDEANALLHEIDEDVPQIVEGRKLQFTCKKCGGQKVARASKCLEPCFGGVEMW